MNWRERISINPNVCHGNRKDGGDVGSKTTYRFPTIWEGLRGRSLGESVPTKLRHPK